ncbi:MAG: hypothetical protein NVSMB44_34850 [Ktedonobacteraceae bacterium]
MSSDRKDAGSTWQGPPAPQTNRNQTHQQAPEQEEAAVPPKRPSGRDLRQSAPDASQTNNVREDVKEADAGSGAASRFSFAQFELLKQARQYLTLIIIPLLFGALTCLFVLPRVAMGQASLPPEGFWPILLVILAVTIAQGVTIYYAGTDNGMWMLGTAGGFCLFLLVGCFALFGAPVGLLFLLALVIVAAALAPRCLHPVSEGFVDIVFVGGKYRRTLYPGFNILLPWEKIFKHLNTEEVQWICPAQVVQLSHDDDVMLRAVISYQLLQEDAYLAVTQVRNWEDSLRALFITTLQSIATVFQPADFLPWPNGLRGQQTAPGDDDFMGSFERRQAINTYLFRLVRDKVALWGVQINWVSIRDIELTPHGAVPIYEQPAPTPAPKQEAPAAQIPTAKQATQPAQPVQPTPKPRPQEQTPAAKNPPKKQAAAPSPRANTTPGPKAAEQPAPAGAQQTTTPALSEDILKQAYRAVQEEHITDPETIRGIAARFEMAAQDPEFSQTVSFDPQRAALNLYERARIYEEQYTRNAYAEDTQPDWIVRRPTDENLMAGG